MHELEIHAINETSGRAPDVSIVMPCLNEAESLAHCIANAREALALMRRDLGLSGEIVIADNGSTDGSQLIARALGVRVVDVPARGYGAALIGGFSDASGRYLVMGDCDGSYDFREAVGLVRLLRDGADLAMGSRFRGGIAPGAMPWKNRHIGNPVLTGILNLFFGAGVSDAHCGLRALTKNCFLRLGLTGSGMEFASEMIIKAALKERAIAEAPATLSPDIRDRPPHLRPWRDGWRHLRYLLMLSPAWAFAVPGALAAVAALFILAMAGAAWARGSWETAFFGNYWVVLAGSLLGMSHTAALFAASTHLYGVRAGYRKPLRAENRLTRWISLETMLLSGVVLFLLGLALLTSVLFYWQNHNFDGIRNVLPAVLGSTLMVVGAQNALGGFLLASGAGNEAAFLKPAARQTSAPVRNDAPERIAS
ncbi:glycosyltransferase family 2 protein [Rhodoblastus sp.]|uniref:glycosyltransferase family 2 protein n=1 Tax=Rhodoblastus sp. TaxID=1962975 RepID=UPI0035B27F0A